MTRRYDSALRRASARSTRSRILDRARNLLLDDGYDAMTVAGLASAAGVSTQTVYNAVGGKGEVVKAVYDVLLAGDEEPVAMSDRPEFRAMADASDARAYAHAYARWTAAIYARVGPLLGVLLSHGPAGDPVLEEFVATIDRERRTGNGHAVRTAAERYGLPPGRSPRRVTDAIWTLTAPEVHHRLVGRNGWSRGAFEEWLGDQIAVVLTAPAGRA